VLVRRALASLPANQRAVLVLRFFGDLSEAEIAEILRCPVGTVKSRANRALAALRVHGLLSDESGVTGVHP
jgi:RNA polymerase sigma factor (sigma-70 family)